MDTKTIFWRGWKWTLTKPTGARYWGGMSQEGIRAMFVEDERGRFHCLFECEPRNSFAPFPMRERRQKDMGPENPEYHWDWHIYG